MVYRTITSHSVDELVTVDDQDKNTKCLSNMSTLDISWLITNNLQDANSLFWGVLLLFFCCFFFVCLFVVGVGVGGGGGGGLSGERGRGGKGVRLMTWYNRGV